MSSEAQPLRALVLAAGYGERLRPLTDVSPKPLLPVLGVPVIEHTLRALATAGVESAAVNLHHLGEQIPTRLGASIGAMSLTYSPETELLGTLGPLARLREQLSVSDPILMINGDSLCRWPVGAMVRAHRAANRKAVEGNARATLLLSANANPAAFGGGVVVDGRGRILSFRGEERPGAKRRGVFSGFHALSPDLLEGIEERPSDIVRELYEPLLERGELIQGMFTRRRWHDLGTPKRYLDGVLDSIPVESGSQGWLAPGSQVDPSASIDHCVIESDVAVGRDATIEDSLLMARARVGRGSTVRRAIVGPGVVVDPGASVDDRLLTLGSVEGEAGSTRL